MSFSLNRVMLAGNLTRDPEVRNVGASQVAKFALAMNRSWKDKATGEKKEEVTYVDCECWGRTAELVGQYLTRGRGCFVEGRLSLDKWQTKDGEPRQSIRVVADSVQFLGAKPADGERAEPAMAAASGAIKPVAADTDEPPF